MVKNCSARGVDHRYSPLLRRFVIPNQAIWHRKMAHMIRSEIPQDPPGSPGLFFSAPAVRRFQPALSLCGVVRAQGS